MMTEAMHAYCTYLAMRQHFTRDSYDYFKYNKKVNASYATFDKRKDKFMFAVLAKRGDDLENFLLANMKENPKIWINELLSSTSEDNYKEWKIRQESMTYIFKNDIYFMGGMNASELNEVFEVKGASEHPTIIKMFLEKEITLETLIILNRVLTFLPKYDKIHTDPLYTDVSRLCKKYQPFLKMEKQKAKSIVKNVVGL
jgi:hypothetical protein